MVETLRLFVSADNILYYSS